MMRRAIGVVFRKELIDVLRDRRTLVFMLVVPTIAIPLLMWLTTGLMISSLKKLQREPVTVLVLNPQAAPRLLERMRADSAAGARAGRLLALLAARGLDMRALSLLRGEDPRPFERMLAEHGIDREAFEREVRAAVERDDLEVTPETLRAHAFPPRLQFLTEPDGDLAAARDPARREAVLLEAVRTKRIAAALRFGDDTARRLDAGDATEVSVYYLESSDRSTIARDGLRQVLGEVGARITRERVLARALPGGFARPLKVRTARLPGPGMIVKLMSQILPYLLILFAFLGALYPAIDLGAGEKERGTLETLLVAPASRLAIILGKFGVILVASIVSAILATASLAVSLQTGLLSEIALAGGGATFSFRPLEAVVALLLVVPVAWVFAALLLALSIFAKSYKEAQSYASPLTMVIILPAFVSFLPGMQLDWTMALVPVVNVSLALKEIFTGNLDQHYGHVAAIFLSTSVIAGLLLWFAAWWSRREEVLFRS